MFAFIYYWLKELTGFSTEESVLSSDMLVVFFILWIGILRKGQYNPNFERTLRNRIIELLLCCKKPRGKLLTILLALKAKCRK